MGPLSFPLGAVVGSLLQRSVTPPVGVGLFAVALAVVHLFAGRLWTDGEYRPDVLSAAGGASLAYVLVHLLPEVDRAVRSVVETTAGPVGVFGREVEAYVVVLLGFLLFYLVHALAARTTTGDTDRTSLVFWMHVTSFALYNALIGILVYHQEFPGLASVGTYTVAMGLHVLVTDAGLRRHHGAVYDDVGRWVLAAAILVGAVLGSLARIPAGPLALLFAFLGGGVLFNVMKEELPDPASSSFGAFLLGALGYTAVLLSV
ncbi:hypothetical protein [Halomarina rubra]|uniref:Uncharacterized protein n=1 Tax=Halomarina rubra TaxID=2071873 RepID=A0ABD6AS26_9EURY|nr:hypothetical protein [Halomarina rubra]